MQEVSIQRDLAAGDVWRLQKEVRNTKDVLLSLTKHNRKFLHLRDKVLPNLQEIQKTKQENIKAKYSYQMFASVHLWFTFSTTLFLIAFSNPILIAHLIN